MAILRSRGVGFVLVGVVLQSFCSLRLVFFNPILSSVTQGIFDLSNAPVFVFALVAAAFFSKIIGVYTLGKYAESTGFLKTQKIIITGYLLTTVLFFLCCLYASDFYVVKTAIVLIAGVNVILFPATFMFPLMYLMKNNDASNHIRISALVIFSALLGHELAYVILNYVVKYDLILMSSIFIGCSFLCGVVYTLGKQSVLRLEQFVAPSKKDQALILPSHLAKALAILIGCVCGAGLSHNYFFIEPYALNISIVNADHFNLVSIFFYVALGTFLIFASKICKYVNYIKLMFGSLVCILLLKFGLKMFDVPSTYGYLMYETLFALFFAGFLAPSLPLIFSLFQNSYLFFNGTVWCYFGFSSSYLAGYFLSKQLGIFPQYFLLASPLIFNGVLCILALIVIHFAYSSSQKCKYNILTCSRTKKLNLDTIGKCW